MELSVSEMKQTLPEQSFGTPPPRTASTGDTATLELLAAWKVEDATADPEKLRQADEEIVAFKKAMNETRAASGARLLFP
jgi:hypothetical protein